MKSSLLSLVLLIFLVACISENDQKTAGAVVNLWQATKANISRTDATDTDNGKSVFIELTMSDLKSVPPGYDLEKVASISAMTMVNNLDESSREEVDYITVKIEDDGENYEKSYAKNEMIEADKLLSIVLQFFDHQQKGEIEQLRDNIDASIIPDSITQALYATMNEIDSLFGKIQHINVTGFQFKQAKDPKIPVIIAWAEVTNGDYLTDYELYLSRTSSKIVYIGINK